MRDFPLWFLVVSPAWWNMTLSIGIAMMLGAVLSYIVWSTEKRRSYGKALFVSVMTMLTLVFFYPSIIGIGLLVMLFTRWVDL